MINNLKITTFCLMLLLSFSNVFASTFKDTRKDFRDESIYFVMTTRFYDGDVSNNTYCWDGINTDDPEWRGDFKGLIDKLDYIKALGFTSVWVTPVVENASGYDYHGYHAMNFSRVDPRYESEDCSFQDLINAVHARDMKIILDIVLQHTGNFGEENLCPLFTRDYTQNLSNLNKSMKLHPNTTLPKNYFSLPGSQQFVARLARMKNTPDENGVAKNYDSRNLWHHYGHFNWDDITCQWAQIAGDCVDLNTENPLVYNYLIKCYNKFIEMGVDGFRIDTAKHLSRLVFNKAFIQAFHNKAKEMGKDNFFMFGEVCTLDRSAINRNTPPISTPYYTWKSTKEYAWSEDTTQWTSLVCMNGKEGFTTTTNQKSCIENYEDDKNESKWRANHISKNALLDGNSYHEPDHSLASGLNVIDFPMHWNYENAESAFRMKDEDKLYNDATFNVTYVDSHDYAPDGAPSDKRFAKSQDVWAKNLDLMFTFRGIPCIYYGSEIEFRKGYPIDRGPTIKLKDSGRAYIGGYLKGEVNVSDFADYSSAKGNIAATLSHPLSLHIQRLNKIRMAIPALRKGQYSTDGCNGGISFKRRYTDETTDSYALVTIGNSCTFTNVLNGKYVEVITGETINVTNSKLNAICNGVANMRIYVLDTQLTPAPGKIGEDGKYLYAKSPVENKAPKYDGTEEEGEYETIRDTDNGGGNAEPEIEEPETPTAPEMKEGEQAVFFERSENWGGHIKVWVWNDKENFTGGNWPGQNAQYLGNKIYKWTYTGDRKIVGNVIFSDGRHQTKNLKYVNGGYYNMGGYIKTIEGAGNIPDNNPDVTPDESSWTAYFEKPADWTENINAYVYHKDNGFATPLSSWPGSKMTLSDDGLYRISFNMNIKKGWIIFNDGKKQTKGDPGFVLINNGVYNIDGFMHEASVEDVINNNEFKAYTNNGLLYIISNKDRNVSITSVDGIERKIVISEGTTTITDLPRGFYIVNGIKIIL